MSKRAYECVQAVRDLDLAGDSLAGFLHRLETLPTYTEDSVREHSNIKDIKVKLSQIHGILAELKRMI